MVLKGLSPRHHEQIEVRFLSVAQEEVFADRRPKAVVDDLAVLHGVRLHKGVVCPPELDAQLVQQVIGADFLFQPPGAVFGAAMIQFQLHTISLSHVHIAGASVSWEFL